MASGRSLRRRNRMKTRKIDYEANPQQRKKRARRSCRKISKLKLQSLQSEIEQAHTEIVRQKEEMVAMNCDATWESWTPNTTSSSLGSWVSYDKTLNDIFERSFCHGVNIITFILNDIKYVACLQKMQQHRTDGVPEYEQPIRRRVEDVKESSIKSAGITYSRNWISEPRVLQHERAKVYEITQNTVKNLSAKSRDRMEYEFASSLFTRLLLGKQPQPSFGLFIDPHVFSTEVTQVDIIIYPSSSSVTQRYESLKESFSSEGKVPKEILVFHGTDAEAVQMIIAEGFKVGGAGEVKVKNGTSHGSGVYTGTGPAAAVQYGRGSGRVILAKALVGNPCEVYPSTVYGWGRDSWSPEKDWMVFKEGHQLQPLYVIHFLERHDFHML